MNNVRKPFAPPTVFTGDLDAPRLEDYLASRMVGVDSETLGLHIPRDRLCVVQLCNEEGLTSLVRVTQPTAPRLQTLLEADSLQKVFHFARFDLGSLRHWLGIRVQPVFCTKIASRLARTYTDRHGLKDLVKELLEVDLDKEQQSSDWAAEELSPRQVTYAANDVIHLAALRDRLEFMLRREGRWELALEVMACLPARVSLDLAGWPNEDLFAHM
ncbi:MAG: ribonuclease D [Magnetococcales bacterium]|nr:ribonuclease D [Magnetococcales bacterium]